MYLYAPSGQTYSSVFILGVATGTTIQTMANNSQYGAMILTSGDLVSINNGTNLTGHYSSFPLLIPSLPRPNRSLQMA